MRESEPKKARSAQGIARGVALTYFALATLWIIGSGRITSVLPSSLAQRFELTKGLLFVIVTALLLWVVVRSWAMRYSAQVDEASGARRTAELVMRTVPVGVVISDGDGRIEHLNPAAERMLATRSADNAGMHLSDVVRPLDPELTDVAELMRLGRVNGLEITVAGESHARAFIAYGASIGPVEPPEQERWVVALTDVSESHEEGERIRRLVNGYRFMSQALHLVDTARDRQHLLDSVCSAATKDGVFSAAWVTAPDAGSGRLSTIASAGLLPEVLPSLEARVDTPEQSSRRSAGLLRGGGLYVVNDLRHGADSHPWLAETTESESSASFQINGQDRPIAFLTLFAKEVGYFDQEQIRLVETLREAIAFALQKLELDTKRIEAEESLLRSEAAYRSIFERHPAPMWVYDRSTLRFLAVNEAAVRKYGYTRDEFESMTILDIRPAEDLPKLLRSVAHRQGPINGNSGYWTHVDKSGRAFTVNIHSNSVDWQGAEAQLVLAQEVATVG